jgi:PAS domain S-box-containing protein
VKKHIARYHEIIENLNDAVYTVDIPSLRFTSVNAAGERLTGYTKKEILSITVAHIVASKHLPIVKKMIRQKRKRKETIYEVDIVRKDGSHVPVEISSRAIYENDTPVEIIGVARDITERKIMEMQRNVFVSLLTHEIKNPLTAIGMYFSLLKKSVTEKAALQHIASINSQLRAIDGLLADFMDASQLRTGKFALQFEPVDMNTLIQEITQDYPAISHRLVVEGNVKKKVWGDRNRIRQVLTNLLSNAIKYSSDESRIITSLSEKDEAVVISVADSGFGIPKEEQRQIFDLFMRTTEASKKNIRGNGLGLYICREIVKGHKGKIWLKSAVGVGSTFFVSLPTGK